MPEDIKIVQQNEQPATKRIGCGNWVSPPKCGGNWEGAVTSIGNFSVLKAEIVHFYAHLEYLTWPMAIKRELLRYFVNKINCMIFE